MKTQFVCPCCGKETIVEVSCTINQKLELHKDMTTEEHITLTDVKIEPVHQGAANVMEHEREANKSD